MDKTNPKISKAIEFKIRYRWALQSKFGYRQKSSYRRLIKRHTNKILRLGEKHIIRECYYEE